MVSTPLSLSCLAELCRQLGGCSKRDVQRALWWKISAANNAEKKRSGLADLQGREGVLRSALDVGPRGVGIQGGRGGLGPGSNASSSASVAGFRPHGASASVSGAGPPRAPASVVGVMPFGSSAAVAGVTLSRASASVAGFTHVKTPLTEPLPTNQPGQEK